MSGPYVPFAEQLRQEAAAAFARMQEAALEARRISAAAELNRHMQLATAGVTHLPRAEAIERVLTEWLNAWNQSREGWAALLPAMRGYAGAVYDYVGAPTEAHDAALRAAWTALKAAHDTVERTVEDQMAWRSEMALPWWAHVRPAPPDVTLNAKALAKGPRAATAFWS